MLARLFQTYAEIFSIATFQPASPAGQYRGEGEPARRSEHVSNGVAWPPLAKQQFVAGKPELPRAA